MSEPNFFSELKRRNVYKVAVAYIVVSWLLIQAASILLPTFDAPASAMKILVALLAIGFPIALGFSWAFEITPEGIKRESEVAPEQSIASHTGRRLAGLTIGLAVIAAALFAFQLLRPHAQSVGDAVSVPTKSDGKLAASPTNPPAIPDKSIAVLPFDNLSDEKANAYFAEGIQDEILTRLAKIGALKVISRSSTKQYQAKPGNLREIAQQLGVANILEGSVQKAGTAVHVNVQLIKAMTDDHLWAESYDRTLENIFGVEGEIAQAVADALRAKLSGAEEKLLAQKPTTNAAAYEAYLRGTTEASNLTFAAPKTAISAFQEAVRLDPDFAVAWAALSQLSSRTYFGGDDLANTSRTTAERALKEAVRLQPDLPETQLARAGFQYWVVHDYPGALKLLQELRLRWPNNSEVTHTIGLILARLGRWSESLEMGDQNIALDPKNLLNRLQWITISLATRDFARTTAMIDSALQAWPNERNLLGLRATVLQAEGKVKEAQSILSTIAFDDKTEPSTADTALAYQALITRDPSLALKMCEVRAHGALSAEPGFLLGWALLQNQAGKTAEARANNLRARDIFEKLHKAQPTNDQIIGDLAFISAALGQRDETLRLLKEYDANAVGDARSSGSGPELRARCLVRLGDKDGAIAALEEVLAAPSDAVLGPPLTPALLRLDPDFDSLRGDPRFEKLCQEKTK